MKNKRIMALTLATALLLVLLTSCGGELTSAAKETRTADSYNTIEVGNIIFQVPSYCEGDTSTETITLYAEKGESAASFSFQGLDEHFSEEEFSSDCRELSDGAIEGLADGEGISNLTKEDTKEFNTPEGIQASETNFKFDLDNNGNAIPATGKFVFLNNEACGTIIITCLLQTDNTEFDYQDAFMKVINEAKIVAGSNKDNNSDSKGESAVDPAFKKTMDEYEAWFDHYCDVMKKAKDNPSDLELLTEMTELLSEEADMLDEMNNMDQSEMTSAELKYYLEVTTRIEKKLIDVAS